MFPHTSTISGGTSLALLIGLKAGEMSGIIPLALRKKNYPFLIEIDYSSLDFKMGPRGAMIFRTRGKLQEGSVMVRLFLPVDNFLDFHAGESFAAMPWNVDDNKTFFELVVDLCHLEIHVDEPEIDDEFALDFRMGPVEFPVDMDKFEVDFAEKIFRHVVPTYVPVPED